MALKLIATCSLGLEPLLLGELKELGVDGAEEQRGAVRFGGGWAEVYRACWRLRTANRVLIELDSWPAADGDALYAGMRRLVEGGRGRWQGLSAERLFDPSLTFSIRATSARSRIGDVRWAALRLKDGLVDGQRQRYGRRGSVERHSPDLYFRLWLHSDRATLLLDTAGEPLDRRGYRLESTQAPLREQLAAACVLASGWDGRGPVVDPMCGSGTLLAEAASWALGRAPGMLRRGWAFERLPGFKLSLLEEVRAESLPTPGPEVQLMGVDRSAGAIAAAEVNLRQAGLADRCQLRQGDAFEFEPPPGPGLVLVNPAYGERLEESDQQWRRLGDLFKQRYKGWRAVVIAGDARRGKGIGLRPERRWPVRNGPLDARLLVFSLY